MTSFVRFFNGNPWQKLPPKATATRETLPETMYMLKGKTVVAEIRSTYP